MHRVQSLTQVDAGNGKEVFSCPHYTKHKRKVVRNESQILLNLYTCLLWLLRDSPPVAADFLAGGVVFGDELNQEVV